MELVLVENIGEIHVMESSEEVHNVSDYNESSSSTQESEEDNNG